MSKKYFPFAPGIPWYVKNGKYIKPKVSGSILQHHLKDKDIVVVAFGGLLESFFSLSILETINFNWPGHNLYWCGYSQYYSLVEMNGLAKPIELIYEKTLKRFPTPIFMDKEGRAYFNCLNNYIKVKTYYQTCGYNDFRPVVRQIVEKSTSDWNIKFIPKMRALEQEKISNRAPYILLFPDRTEMSQHEFSGLDWDIRQIRSFAAMLQPNYRLIIMANNTNLYFNMNAEVIPFSINTMMKLIPKAYAVLSKDVDILMISLALSNAKIFSQSLPRHLDLNKNNKWLLKENDIYTVKKLTPEYTWNYINTLRKE